MNDVNFRACSSMRTAPLPGSSQRALAPFAPFAPAAALAGEPAFADFAAPALIFDYAVMFGECRGRLAPDRQGPRFQLLGGRRIDLVHDSARRQRAAEGIGDAGRGRGPHGNADIVGVAAHGKVIGHDLDRRGAFLAG